MAGAAHTWGLCPLQSLAVDTLHPEQPGRVCPAAETCLPRQSHPLSCLGLGAGPGLQTSALGAPREHGPCSGTAPAQVLPWLLFQGNPSPVPATGTPSPTVAPGCCQPHRQGDTDLGWPQGAPADTAGSTVSACLAFVQGVYFAELARIPPLSCNLSL